MKPGTIVKVTRLDIIDVERGLLVDDVGVVVVDSCSECDPGIECHVKFLRIGQTMYMQDYQLEVLSDEPAEP